MPAISTVSVAAYDDAFKLFLGSGTWKVILLNNAYTPSPGTHLRRSHISTWEVTGTNCPVGGVTISTNPFTFSIDTTGKAIVTIAAISLPNITVTGVRHAYLYKSLGAAADDILVRLFSFAGVENRTAASLDITSGTWTTTIPAYSFSV